MITEHQLFQQIYDAMTGEQSGFLPRLEKIPDEMNPQSPCGMLSEQAFQARLQMNIALSGDPDQDSPEMLRLVSCYEKMERYLCEKAFAYGVLVGKGEL